MSRSQGPIIIYTWFSHGGEGGNGGEISRRLFTIDFQEGEGGEGVIRILQNLGGGSGKYHYVTIKIVRPPLPQAIVVDQSLTVIVFPVCPQRFSSQECSHWGKLCGESCRLWASPRCV